VVPCACSRYLGEYYEENKEIKRQNCNSMIELVELLTSEIKSTRTMNKLLLQELNRIGGEYKFNEVLKTLEKPNIQNKIYPLNGNVTVRRNSENKKKNHKGKTTGSAGHKIQATSQ
jgi:hypothetical protein